MSRFLTSNRCTHYLFLSMIAASVAPTAVIAQSVPNVQQSAPGDLLFHVKNSSEYEAQSRIRVAVIDYLGGYVITTPEGPGSNAQTALDRRILAWDVSDPQNPEIKYSFSFSNDQFFTQSGFRAHGSMLRGNQLNVGNDSNAITLMPDGSLALQPWEGARRPSEITGVDGQIYTTNQNRDNPFAANTASMNRPWNFVESWNYSSQAADADGDKVADSSGAIILGDQQLTKWDITGGDKVRGFGTFMGNLFLHSSDQRNNGMAVYDMTDIRSENGETKPRLLDTINTPGATTNGAGIGGYWSEAVSHYMVFASRDDNNSGRRGVQAVDFSDPQNLKLACQFDAGTHNDWRLRPQTMYLGFKDEYVYSDNYKLNLETCDATAQWQPELTLDVAQGQSTKVVDTTQYSRVIGNLWFTGGHPQGSSNSLGGMAIWVDQSAPDSRAPAVAYHIPQQNQTNYPTNLPLSFSIPETLDSTTLITTETAAPGQTETLTLTEVGGSKVRVDYVLAHSGMLTLDPVNGLKANTTYEVSFTDGIQEATGNRMQPYAFRFSTGDSIDIVQPPVLPVVTDVAVSPSQTVEIGDAVTIAVTAANANEYDIRLEGESEAWNSDSTRTFSFDQIGQYNVQARARNNNGASDVRLITINVENNRPEPPIVDAVTVDNSDAATNQIGGWITSGGANPHAGGSVYSSNSASKFIWNAELAAGNYDVQVYWTYFGNRTTQAVYSVAHRDGVANIDKNQRNEGESGRWVSVGQYAFAAGDAAVTLSNAGQGTLSADAVRFVPIAVAETVTVDNTNTATSQIGFWGASGGVNPHAGGSVYSSNSASKFIWNAELAAGNYDVQVYWTYFGNRTTQAVYSVAHRDGVDNIDKNQRNEGESGRWVSIGQYAFAAGDAAVTLSNAGQGTLSADAIRFVPR